MPEETQANAPENTSDGTAIKTAEANAGETQTSKSQTEESHKQQSETKTFTQADLEKYATKVRREEKAKFEQQLKDAQLSESDRQSKRIAELEQELRTRTARDSVIEAARKAGALDPEQVFYLGERLLEFDKDNPDPTNIKDLIDYAKEKVPSLFPKRPGSANGGEGQVGSFGQSMNDIIRRSAGRQ